MTLADRLLSNSLLIVNNLPRAGNAESAAAISAGCHQAARAGGRRAATQPDRRETACRTQLQRTWCASRLDRQQLRFRHACPPRIRHANWSDNECSFCRGSQHLASAAGIAPGADQSVRVAGLVEHPLHARSPLPQAASLHRTGQLDLSVVQRATRSHASVLTLPASRG